MSIGTVRTHNPSSPWFAPMTVGIPFPVGSEDVAGIAIGGVPASIHHRTYWPDGSLRWVAASWTPLLETGSSDHEVSLAISSDRFETHDAVIAAAASFSIHAMGYVLRRTEHLASDAVVRRFRMVYTSAEHGWLWVTVEFRSRSAIARLWLDWGWSDPTVSHVARGDSAHPLPEPPTLVFSGAEPVLWHADRYDYRVATDGQVASLMLDPIPADGQAQHREGLLLFPPCDCPIARRDFIAAKIGLPPTAISLDWASTDALTPLGSLAGAEDGSVADAVAIYRSGEHGSWDRPHLGMQRYPGQTGNQEDIGVANPWVLKAARSQRPEYLPAIQRSVGQEACRPVHFRETDGRAFRHADHPQCVLWDERPHQHPSVSPDRLGKVGDLSFSDARGWTGYDRQHQHRNLSAGYALLSGCPSAIERCDLEVERWMAAHPIETPSPVIRGIGQARAARSIYAGSQLLWVTGRQDLADRIRDRITVSYLGHWRNGDGVTPPRSPSVVEVGDPDTRVPFAPPFCFPWQNATLVWCLRGALGALPRGMVQGSSEVYSMLATYAAHALANGMRVDGTVVEVGKSQQVTTGETEWWSGWRDWVLPFVQILALTGNSKAQQIETALLTDARPQWRLR